METELPLQGKRIRLIFAEDHEMVRIGIRHLLKVRKDIEIVAEATNGKEAVEYAVQHEPDIVLLDLLMPEMDGIAATELIKRKLPETIVLILTSYEEQDYLVNALQAGADGYLSKEVSAPELGNAIEAALNNKQVFSPSILDLLQGRHPAKGLGAGESVSLTKREQEILQLVAQGMTSQQIAEQLFISPRTVETHRANLMEKLGVNNTAGLVRFALLNTTYSSRSNTGDTETK